MMKHYRILSFFLVCTICFAGHSEASRKEGILFHSAEDKDQFSKEISGLIETAWKEWQDSVLIGDIDVEGSYGILTPGDITGPVLTAASVLEDFDRKDRSQGYINCVRAIAGAIGNGMRVWQKGYSHDNIPFPQGASCTYTLPPCTNVPVTVASGQSLGDKVMTEDDLYNYMLYRAPQQEEDIIVLHGAAKAISECFIKWKNSCSIVGILASGGMAPHPSPMGTGPGPVRGAKGHNGKLIGPYIDASMMYDTMVEYYNTHKAEE